VAPKRGAGGYVVYRFLVMTISNFNLMFLKSSNMHANESHASNPTILPYNVKNQVLADLFGLGFSPIFLPCRRPLTRTLQVLIMHVSFCI